MTAFEEFGIAPRLVLSGETLRAAYDELCQSCHPDRGGEAEKFSRVQEAYETLRDPGRRLRAWVEGHGGQVAAGGDEDTLELFAPVGELVRRADAVLERKAEGKSALVRALAEKEGLVLMREIETLREQLSERREAIVDRFGMFDEAGPDECLGEAAVAAANWAFLDRWDRQLNERWIRLGM